MKVFIHHQFLDNPAFAQHNARLAEVYRLDQQLRYLHDMVEALRAVETTAPDEADFFFLPLFLAGWQFANHDPADFLALCPHLDRGRHLLLATADIGQRAPSPQEAEFPGRAYASKYAWLDKRFILLALESTPSLLPQDVAFLPYPVRDISPWHAPRDLFASFMGAMSYPQLVPEHIRGARLLALQARHAGDPAVLLGTPQEAAAVHGRPLSYDEVMARSVFTLCPAGYGRWSFRFVEALLHGSIPVLLADDYVLPFAGQVRWEDYAIVVPEARSLEVVDLLRAQPVERVARLQANILRDRERFMKAGVMEMIRAELEARTAGGV